ncbi:MAG: glycerate 2-kinase [Solirubrobacteraceae bacterium]|nr:glycerate 2-kinase [Solirubrobacteraceae bacterium]
MSAAGEGAVVVAPDSFKGTFTASEAGEAIAQGLRAAGVGRALVAGVADGGEGTLDVLAGAIGAELRTVAVHDPLGRRIEASYALGPGGVTAVVEVARAAGLGLVAAAERDPWRASSAGVGELIVAARDAGAGEILLGLGGSATTDGGAGAIAAIERGGGLRGTRLILLCDVRTPFEAAAAVFAPQKGADRETVGRLSRRLEDQAGALPRDPRGVPMTGAAGGLSGGLWARFGAELVAGSDYVLDRLGFDRLLEGAMAVVTGEGRLDAQTRAGKAASAVTGRAVRAGVAVHAVVGENALAEEEWRRMGLASVREAGTAAALTAAGRELAGVLLEEGSGGGPSRERRR